LPANAELPMLFGNCQMMKITAPSVVATKYGANNLAAFFDNETETRVAPQIRGDGWARVGFIEFHAFGPPPQGNDRVIIFNAESADDHFVVA